MPGRTWQRIKDMAVMEYGGVKAITIYDSEARQAMEVLSRKKLEDGSFLIRAKYRKTVEKAKKEADDKALNAKLRNYMENRLVGDIQLDGYILVGWWADDDIIAERSTKQGHRRGIGKAAYLPKTGDRWIYVYDYYGTDAPHPDPRWENKRFTQFVEKEKRPTRYSRKKVLEWLSEPKPEPFGLRLHTETWMPTVPLWLLSDGPDMRPLYLAGGSPKTEEAHV
jgi:hypothetical protein